MIKRSYFALNQPRLMYDSIKSDSTEPESIPVPDNIIVSVNEPLDSSKSSIYKTGDKVEKGEKIRLYNDSEEYAVSPVSGEIIQIDIFPDDFGTNATFFVIKNDQEETSKGEFTQHTISPDIESANDFLRTLPGAPPLKILADPEIKVHTLVVTCTDDDLLSTTRQYLGLHSINLIKEGIQILKNLTKIPKVCVAIPEDLKLSGELDKVQTLRISSSYPSALPQMIMKDHLNTVVPAGKSCEDMGVCFISAEAVVSIAQTYQDKEPVFDKVFTLIGKDGSKKRVKATIGTPLSKVFSNFSIHINDRDRIIVGGPMRGFATFTTHYPVTCSMDTIIIQDRDIIPVLSDNACINCGKCINICPAKIPVNILVRYLEADQYEEAADGFDLESCIECGLCSYVCTARIPLFQYIRLGKYELSKLRADT